MEMRAALENHEETMDEIMRVASKKQRLSSIPVPRSRNICTCEDKQMAWRLQNLDKLIEENSTGVCHLCDKPYTERDLKIMAPWQQDLSRAVQRAEARAAESQPMRDYRDAIARGPTESDDEWGNWTDTPAGEDEIVERLRQAAVAAQARRDDRYFYQTAKRSEAPGTPPDGPKRARTEPAVTPPRDAEPAAPQEPSSSSGLGGQSSSTACLPEEDVLGDLLTG